MSEIWGEYLKKEKIKTRIFLDKEMNIFLESLTFDDFEMKVKSLFTVSYKLKFKKNNSIFKVTKTVAVNGNLYPGDVPPFITWKYYLNDELIEIKEINEENLNIFFDKFMLKVNK